MSHAGGIVNSHALISTASWSEASTVQMRIESLNSQISGLFMDLNALSAQLQSLLAELAALTPPTAPTAPDANIDDGGVALAAYQQQLQEYQRQLQDYNSRKAQIEASISDVNARSQDVARRIADAQAKLNQLQSFDLPRAQANDIERQQRELDQAREQYNALGRQLEEATSSRTEDRAEVQAAERRSLRVRDVSVAMVTRDDGEVRVRDPQVRSAGGLAALGSDSRVRNDVGGDDSTSGTSLPRLELRVRYQDTEVQLSEDASFKDVVRAFTLVLAMHGDGSDVARRSNPAISMPYTPGTGLPPVELP